MSQEELPRARPLEPAQALEAFRLEPGFLMELVASEPDVVDPVALAFDERGRLLVVEMSDYPFEPGQGQSPEQDARAKRGRVRLLEDADGDGKVDRATTFASDLSWPTGITPWRGGAFVAAAPDILYLRDTDGDGVADQRLTVLTGFGRQNVQGLLNSLTWGPDGWIYGSSATNGGDIAAADGTPVFSARGRDFRLRPRANPRAFITESITGGGQFGMSFDDWGRRFVCTNSSHIRHVVFEEREAQGETIYGPPASVVDIPEDGAAALVFRQSAPEPWRVVRTRWRAASPDRSRYPPTELFPAGFFTSATGIHIYRGALFPPEYRGCAFVGDVGGNLVHRKLLLEDGCTFRARRPPCDATREFLTSSDNWFRPVAFADGPEGALYVLDMYRETIEHPASIPESIKRFLDLKSGDDRGRIWRIVPEGAAIQRASPLEGRNARELAARLDDSSPWVRDTAQRLLLEWHAPWSTSEGPPAGPINREAEAQLRAVARKGTSGPGRSQALATLEALGRLMSDDLIVALADPEAGVREGAAKDVCDGPIELVTDAVRDTLVARVSDPSARVRAWSLLALGRLRAPAARTAVARGLASSVGDRWLEGIATRALGSDVPTLLSEHLQGLGRGEMDPSAGLTLAVPLASLVGARGSDEEVAHVLEVVPMPMTDGAEGAQGAQGKDGADGAGSDAAVGSPSAQRARSLGLRVLAQIAEGRRGRCVGSLACVFQAPTPLAADRLRLWSGVASRLLADGEAPTADRAAALRVAAWTLGDAAVVPLGALLSPRESPAIQLAAIAVLGDLREGVGEVLLERARLLGPAALRRALDALLERPERTRLLLDALEEGAFGASDLPSDQRARLLASADPEIQSRARRLLDAAPALERAQVLEDYAGAVAMSADRSPEHLERGMSVFRRVCAACHKLGEEGQLLAPDFRTVRDRPAESLLLAILDPNREVAQGFVTYSFELADGRVLLGLIAAESAESVTIRWAGGGEETVPRGAILRLESTGLSLMPVGLEKDVTVEEMGAVMARILSGV